MSKYCLDTSLYEPDSMYFMLLESHKRACMKQIETSLYILHISIEPWYNIKVSNYNIPLIVEESQGHYQ